MTQFKNIIDIVCTKLKTAIGQEIDKQSDHREFTETVNRIKQASVCNCDVARVLDNYKMNKTDFRITLKRGSEIKSLKDLDKIKEKYDLSSVD